MFAIRIKNLRQSRELNQVQLAEKLGVKKQSISNWENDNIMPSIDMLIRIANFFHVSTDYLLGRDMHLHLQIPVSPFYTSHLLKLFQHRAHRRPVKSETD